MKSNELRIGNWVLLKNLEIRVIGITCITSGIHDKVEYQNPGTTIMGDTDIVNLKGIPLTEEWAINLGGRIWQKTESARYFVFESDGFDLVIEPKANICYLDTYHSKTFINPIEFVHELQNTWERLTGEELKIKE